MATAKKSAVKKTTTLRQAQGSDSGKAAPKKTASKKNKLGVKNSLVNNINARKKKGISRPKKRSAIDKHSYEHMEEGWDSKKKK